MKLALLALAVLACASPARAGQRKAPVEAGPSAAPAPALVPALPAALSPLSPDISAPGSVSQIPSLPAPAAASAQEAAERAAIAPADAAPAAASARAAALREPAPQAPSAQAPTRAPARAQSPEAGAALTTLFDGAASRDDLDARVAALPEGSTWRRAPRGFLALADGAGRRPAPVGWNKAKRAAALGLTIAALAAVPAAAHPFAALHAHSSFHMLVWPSGLLGRLGVPIALAGAAAAHGLGRWVDALHYWKLGAGEPDRIRRKFAAMWSTPAATVVELSVAAGVEELLFRFALMTGLMLALLALLPLAPAYALSALASAFVFAFTHRYGAVWPRVTSGLVYAGLWALTGSLGVAILAHFLANWLYVPFYAAQQALRSRESP